MSKTIDNLNVLINLLDDDKFYHLEIISRSKETGKTYQHFTNTITPPMLIKRYDNLKRLSESVNARIYLHLTPMDSESFKLDLLKQVVSSIENKNNPIKIFNSSMIKHRKSKYWLIDVDFDLDKNDIISDDLINIANHINSLNPITYETKVKATVRTPNGYHLITDKFDLSKFEFNYDIHKNNPTVLYYNYE